MKSVYEVIMNGNVFCCCFCMLFFYFIFCFFDFFLNHESSEVVRLGWVCIRACGGAHRRKSRFCRGIYF